jgi:hypothetical protein
MCSRKTAADIAKEQAMYKDMGSERILDGGR